MVLRASVIDAGCRPAGALTMRMTSRIPSLAAALLIGALAAAPAVAATIVIQNNDGAGVGFNDPTPAAPVGGNPGTTIGQQRLNVFTQAASIWGAILPSPVTIVVGAQFTALSCNSTSAVLGSAGPSTVIRDFAGEEFAATWYHIALANKLNGTDQAPGTPDISANFNVNLGQTGCLDGSFFYYGFDHNEGTDIDLLAVLLHELGHGLGFSTLVNVSTGQRFPTSGPFDDLFMRHILDNTSGLHWNAMSDAQRQASAINTGNVVWDGTATNLKTTNFLNRRPQVVVNGPPVIAGTYISGSSTFGGPLTVAGVSANVVLANDGSGTTSDACSPLINAAAMAGKICLVDRGTCAFSTKAENAQNAGAVGVILVNNVAGPAAELGGVDPTVTIPVTSLSLATGNAIKAQLGGGVNATLNENGTKYAGADDSNRALLYTPNPVQPGSTISHWDVSAAPSLLMEPIITPDLTSSVDLTRYHFEDLGWLPRTTGVGTPPVTTGDIGFNAPNPFSFSTTIHFTLSQPTSVDLAVYDLGGRLVKRLEQTPLASAGTQTAVWDGTDSEGRRLGPGVYLYRLRTGDHVESHRMVFFR
jgi:hypothetical protein